jgi:uncharacterized damage-inducible protein DinB
MQNYLDEFSRDALQSAAAHSPHETVSGQRAGQTLSLPRAVVLAHVATHGMHHRAQALNMLRQLGVTPLPRSSVIEWSKESS